MEIAETHETVKVLKTASPRKRFSGEKSKSRNCSQISRVAINDDGDCCPRRLRQISQHSFRATAHCACNENSNRQTVTENGAASIWLLCHLLFGGIFNYLSDDETTEKKRFIPRRQKTHNKEVVCCSQSDECERQRGRHRIDRLIVVKYPKNFHWSFFFCLFSDRFLLSSSLSACPTLPLRSLIYCFISNFSRLLEKCVLCVSFFHSFFEKKKSCFIFFASSSKSRPQSFGVW